MSLSLFLMEVGRPVAYYPRLARFLGSVNAAILLSQLYYWHPRNESDLGTHKSSDQLMEETGLSYREQVTARKQLRDAGFLIETPQRLKHRIYFRLDTDAIDAAFEAWSEAQTKAQFPNDENAVGEQPKAQSGDDAKRSPGTAESSFVEQPKAHSVINTETTHKTTTETTAYISPTTADAAVAGAPAAEAEDPRTEAFKALCRETWQAYADAYLVRYKTEPVRNGRANKTVVNLVKRLGAEAPGVARFFVERVFQDFVVRRCHSIGDLLAQCESYRTQWVRDQAVTTESARQADRTASNANAAQGAAEKALAIVAARKQAAEQKGGGHA